MNNNLFKKFMEFGIGSIITLILGFITSPIITRIISPEQNGKFSMFNTIINLLMVIIILGLDQAYVRYYYEEDEESRNQLLKYCIKIPLMINTILGVIAIIFYKYISIYIVEEVSLSVVVLLIVNLFITIISRFALLQIRMKQKGKIYSLLNIIMKIVNLLFVILIFFVYKDNYMTLILASIYTNFIVTGLAIFFERHEFTKNKKTTLKTSKREILKFGIPLVFSMAITWIFQSIDRVTIKQFSGYEELGLYSGAMSIISLLNAVQSTFTTFWVPVAFERYSVNPNDKEFFKKINKIITLVMLIISIGLISCKDIVVLLLGPKYRGAVFIFPFLVFMPIMYTISETTVLGINFKNKSKYHINVATISAIFNFIGNLILVPKYGAKGAAISTGLAYIVFFSLRTYYSVKLYKVDYELYKFAISTVLVYILAIYSSFNTFNIIIFMLSGINIIIICMLYKDILIEFINILKNYINKN